MASAPSQLFSKRTNGQRGKPLKGQQALEKRAILNSNYFSRGEKKEMGIKPKPQKMAAGEKAEFSQVGVGQGCEELKTTESPPIEKCGTFSTNIFGGGGNRT